MKKKGLILLLTGLLVSSSAIQARPVNSVDNTRTTRSLRSVINTIEETTAYRFLYNEQLVDTDKLVSLETTERPITELLANVFEDSGIDYSVVDNQIILKAADAQSAKSVADDQKEIKGTIKDQSGMELVGVSVLVKGTTTGTVTDMDGGYRLRVPENATLVISYIGFVAQEVKVGNNPMIDVILKEDAQSLEEVVVVGYTTQRKADLTGAVSSVKMDRVQDMNVSGINSALQGRMSGVTVLQSSGAPGSGTSIRIRGLGTFGNNEPLYVIDGMPADNMNDINPTDIERIDVLKDASSAAIYGSRAANGVVIIQTKKGSETGKINITFNTYHGFSRPQKKINLLDAQERNEIHLEALGAALADGELAQDKYDSAVQYYSTPFAQETRTNWQDEVLTNSAYQANYDLSLTGGNNKIKYNIMGGHLSQDGILKNSGYERTTLRINSEIEPIKNLTIGENLMLTNSKKDIISEMGSGGALGSALLFDPSVPVYSNREKGIYSGSGELGSDVRNPVSVIDRDSRKHTRNRVFGNVFAQYKFFKDFTFKTDFGYDWTNWKDKWFSARVPEEGRKNGSNELTEREWTNTRWINTNTLKYDKTIGRHKLMVLGGTSYEEYKSDYTGARGLDFISEDKSQHYMNAATRIAWLEGDRREWALQSYLSRLDYSFDDRYLFSASFRADGSSKFASGNRWGYFPSLSGGWRISEESFFEKLKSSSIQSLKLRASWGQLGNQDLSDFYPTKIRTANTTDSDGYNVIFGSKENVGLGRYEATLPNPELKWETTTQTDIGLDVSFLGKFDFGFDYFIKKSEDVLIGIPVSALAGVADGKWVNAADVKNTGFEMNLSYNTQIRDFHINAYGNFSKVKNEVTSMGNNGSAEIFKSSYRGTNITRIAKGQPIGHFYGYKTDGIFRSQEEIDNYVNDRGEKIQPKAKVGDLKFLDIDNDGILDAKDRTNIGSGFPDFTYGFGADIEYKNFDLGFFFQGVAGYDIFNGLKYEGLFVDTRYNQFSQIGNRFHAVNNPNGSGPRVTTKDTNSNQRMSDYYVDKGDYLRLKTLTVGYTLDKNLTRKLHLQKARIYVTMQNLLTFTSYKGFDPELGETYANEVDLAGRNEIGVDRGQFPQPKSFIMGLSINF